MFYDQVIKTGFREIRLVFEKFDWFSRNLTGFRLLVYYYYLLPEYTGSDLFVWPEVVRVVHKRKGFMFPSVD